MGARALIYLDPPYFNQGRDLYENHYGESDHATIARLVGRQLSHPWLVSCDAAPQIMELHRPYPSMQYGISYSAQVTRRD